MLTFAYELSLASFEKNPPTTIAPSPVTKPSYELCKCINIRKRSINMVGITNLLRLAEFHRKTIQR